MRKVLVTIPKNDDKFMEDNRFMDNIAELLLPKGLKLLPVPWDLIPEKYEAGSIVLLFSHYDYIYNMNEFSDFIDWIKSNSIQCYNHPDIIEWNISKSYLLDEQVVSKSAIPLSCKYQNDIEKASFQSIVQAMRGPEIVVKPLIGCSGHNVKKMKKLDVLNHPNSILNDIGEFLAQEYVEGISGGEVSLIFVGGVFSHSIKKIPKNGEYRINKKYDPTLVREKVDTSLVEFARSTISKINPMPLFARVDVVKTKNSYILMEIEVNEPHLFVMPGSNEEKNIGESIFNWIEKDVYNKAEGVRYSVSR